MLVYIYICYALTKNCLHAIFLNYLHIYSAYSLYMYQFALILVYIVPSIFMLCVPPAQCKKRRTKTHRCTPEVLLQCVSTLCYTDQRML